MPDVSESITVSAPALAVYDLVSDLPRMGEWSPECTRVTWLSGTPGPAGGARTPGSAGGGRTPRPAGGARTPGPAVGARFVGYNRAGAVRWFTFGRVVDAVPGEAFSFEIHFGPIPVSLWSYDFKSAGSGCEVTESWTDQRPAFFRRLFRPIFGDRTPRNVHGIHLTLQRLKSTAEAAGDA